MRAARHALAGYSRERGLRRILFKEILPDPGDALTLLLDVEAELDATRRLPGSQYSPRRLR